MGDGGRAARGDILENYRLPEGTTVADIGGADGSVLVELLTDRPERRGIVFDLPKVVAEAAGKLEAAGLSERVAVVAGDFFESVPTADLYVASHVFHDWNDESAVRILHNIGRAAAPGTRLCILDIVIPEGDGPHFAKLVDLVMLAMLGGRERTETEWRALLAEGGFTLDRITGGSGTTSVIEAVLT
jgi:SAM-dependent methyltransferase